MINDTQQYTAKRPRIKEKLRIVEWKIVISQNSKMESRCDRKKKHAVFNPSMFYENKTTANLTNPRWFIKCCFDKVLFYKYKSFQKNYMRGRHSHKSLLIAKLVGNYLEKLFTKNSLDTIPCFNFINFTNLISSVLYYF